METMTRLRRHLRKHLRRHLKRLRRRSVPKKATSQLSDWLHPLGPNLMKIRSRHAWGPNLTEAPLSFACRAPRVRTAKRKTCRNFLRLSRATPVKPEEDSG